MEKKGKERGVRYFHWHGSRAAIIIFFSNHKYVSSFLTFAYRHFKCFSFRKLDQLTQLKLLFSSRIVIPFPLKVGLHQLQSISGGTRAYKRSPDSNTVLLQNSFKHIFIILFQVNLTENKRFYFLEHPQGLLVNEAFVKLFLRAACISQRFPRNDIQISVSSNSVCDTRALSSL